MNILVTGGAGFIGSHLTERLLREGHQVSVVDNFDPFYDPQRKRQNLAAVADHPALRLYEADILDWNRMDAILAQEKPERIVHLAARANTRLSLSDALLYEKVIGQGTVTLLELARRHRVQQFVFGSSSTVYGANSKVPFSEDDPITSPLTPYAAAKRDAELHCHVYARVHRLPVTCLRFFSVYGPRLRPDLALSVFVQRILSDEEVPFYGDGSAGRDYTYIDDIVDGIVAALARLFPYEIINLGNSHPILLREMLATLERALGKQATLRQLPSQPGDMHITYADIAKAERLLGYRPQVPFREGVARFVAWYRQEVAGSSSSAKQPSEYG